MYDVHCETYKVQLVGFSPFQFYIHDGVGMRCDAIRFICVRPDSKSDRNFEFNFDENKSSNQSEIDYNVWAQCANVDAFTSQPIAKTIEYKTKWHRISHTFLSFTARF